MRQDGEALGETQGHRYDPALEVAPGAASERRRHTRALAEWRTACAGRQYPRLGDVGSKTVAGSSTMLFETLGDTATPIDFALGVSGERWADMLAERILPRIAAIRLLRAPLAFEAQFRLGERTSFIRGILLPFAGEDGELRFVRAELSWKHGAAPSADLLAAARNVAPSNPTRISASGTGDTAERIAVARTWAALALVDPARGHASLEAALSATFDILVAGGDKVADLVRTIFSQWPAVERRRLRLALAHAARLGLAAGQLADLLQRYPGGIVGMASTERLVRRRMAVDAATPSAPQAIFRLVPLETPAPVQHRNNEAREYAGTPWDMPIAASPACAMGAPGA